MINLLSAFCLCVTINNQQVPWGLGFHESLSLSPGGCLSSTTVWEAEDEHKDRIQKVICKWCPRKNQGLQFDLQREDPWSNTDIPAVREGQLGIRAFSQLCVRLHRGTSMDKFPQRAFEIWAGATQTRCKELRASIHTTLSQVLHFLPTMRNWLWF